MKKKILLFSILVILFFGFLVVKETKAGPEHNVWGWAWAGDTIGWVSFNSTNTGGAVNYGVNIDPATGVLSGYAWMGSTYPSFGWISFEPADLIGCPSGTCNASLDLDTGALSGWARALSLDSWIKLKGTWADGVSIISNPSPPPASVFKGWAWGNGGSVLGWISFNCSNSNTDYCATVDYKVMTDIVINNPPTAAISCNPPSCEVYYGEPLQLINDSTDPDGDSDIVISTWCFDGYCPLYCDCSDKCNCTPQSEVGIGSYTAGLYVEDATGESDTTTKDFRIKRDITAGFMCSLDNAIWEVCENVIPIDGETVYFNDDLSLLEYSQSSEGAVINSRVWEKDEGVFDSDNNTNPSITASIPSMDIKLTVTDSAGRSDSETHIIGVAMPLPTWKEIVPF